MDIKQALEEIVAKLQDKKQQLTGSERIATARQLKLAQQLLSAVATAEPNKPLEQLVKEQPLEEPRHEDDDDFPEGAF